MIKIILIGDGQHADRYLTAFGQGLGRHGQSFSRQRTGVSAAADLVVFWAHRRHMIIKKQLDDGHDYLVMERGFVGARFDYTSLGYNGLNGRADFVNANVPDDRFYLFEHFMRAWRGLNGKYWVIMGQVAGDASIEHCDIQKWYETMVATIKSNSSIPIVYRPHPLSRQYEKPGGTHLRSGTLNEILSNARGAVTYNSNSGVDAVLAGVPTMAQDKGSMAYPVAAHDFEALSTAANEPDRVAWLQCLSYCQWSLSEIIDGTAWQHLKRRYA